MFHFPFSYLLSRFSGYRQINFLTPEIGHGSCFGSADLHQTINMEATALGISCSHLPLLLSWWMPCMRPVRQHTPMALLGYLPKRNRPSVWTPNSPELHTGERSWDRYDCRAKASGLPGYCNALNRLCLINPAFLVQMPGTVPSGNSGNMEGLSITLLICNSWQANFTLDATLSRSFNSPSIIRFCTTDNAFPGPGSSWLNTHHVYWMMLLFHIVSGWFVLRSLTIFTLCSLYSGWTRCPGLRSTFTYFAGVLACPGFQSVSSHPNLPSHHRLAASPGPL